MSREEIQTLAQEYSNQVAQAGDLMRSLKANREFIEKQEYQLEKMLNNSITLFNRLEKLKATQTIEEKTNGPAEAKEENKDGVSERGDANASDTSS